MRNYFLYLLFSLMTFGLSAQDASAFKLISKGDFAAIAAQMDNEVELILPDASDFYPANKALEMLKAALVDVDPVKWTEKHIGGTKGGLSTYSVGNLKSSKGSTYRLFIVKEKVAEGLKICSLELEKQ